jgi:hypothetical protein
MKFVIPRVQKGSIVDKTRATVVWRSREKREQAIAEGLRCMGVGYLAPGQGLGGAVSENLLYKSGTLNRYTTSDQKGGSRAEDEDCS